MSFGETVRRLRKARGWTQQELGGQAGFPPGTISHIENGRNDNPTQDTLDKLARALNVTVDELLGRVDILAGPWPAGQLRQLGLDPDLLLRYERLWPDLSKDDRSWLLGHLRIMAEAERRVSALEAEARDHPDGALPADTAGPPILVHLVS